ncbi:hypothetical protein QZH41_017656 [Actinostola sp. cb2023]|nr:hypothetical protein QZH41_017656 [Actinostola sp. cb2023]
MCQQVDTIYEVIGRPTAMPDIFNKEVIYNRFFKSKLEERVAGGKKGMSCNTLLVYIHHYRLFAIHVKQTLQLSTMKTIETLVDALPGWRESVRKTRMEQKSTREWNERKLLVTPQQIIDMKTSPHARYCTRLLREPREDSYTLEQAVDVRNSLIFRLCIENGSRAGPIHAMSLEDMKQNERLEDKRIVHVAQHKTTATYGGALMNMSEDLFKDMFRYIRGARQVFLKEGKEDAGQVFLGQYGNPLSAS